MKKSEAAKRKHGGEQQVSLKGPAVRDGPTCLCESLHIQTPFPLEYPDKNPAWLDPPHSLVSSIRRIWVYNGGSQEMRISLRQCAERCGLVMKTWMYQKQNKTAELRL